MTPSLALPHSMNSAARTTCAPGCGLAPGQAVDLALDRAAQQPVPGRVELDLVDPVAVAVVGAQDRLVALGAPAVLARLDAPGDRAGLAGAVDAPAAALALERLLQRQVDLEQVDRLQRRRLVEDLAGGIGDVDRGHDSGAAAGQRPLGHPIGRVVGAAQQPPRELRPAEEQRRVVLPGGADAAVHVDHRARARSRAPRPAAERAALAASGNSSGLDSRAQPA